MKAAPWSAESLPRNARGQHCANHARCLGYARWRQVYVPGYYPWRPQRLTTVYARHCSVWCARIALWERRRARGRHAPHPMGCLVCGQAPRWVVPPDERRYWWRDEDFCSGAPPENFCERCLRRLQQSRVRGDERIWQYRHLMRDRNLRPRYLTMRLLAAEWAGRVRANELQHAHRRRLARRLARKAVPA